MRKCLITAVFTPWLAFAQGPLTPPGPPAPTQKSLQQIWDKLAEVEAKAEALESQLAEESAVSAVLLENAGAALPWRSGIVSPIPATQYNFTSLSFVLSPDGTPSVSWSENSFSNGYATASGTTWNILRELDLYDPPGPAGFQGIDLTRNSLAFSAGGEALRVGSSQPYFVIRRFAGGVFTNTLSAGTLAFGINGGIDLAVLPNGTTVIAYGYQDGGNYHVGYLEPAGATWNETRVANLSFGGGFAMKVSPSGTPTIAFVNSGNSLAIAELGAGGWVTTTVDSGATYNSVKPSLAFGPDGQPAIAAQAAGLSIKVARRSGVSWSVQTVGTSLGGGGWSSSSLDFGPTGRPALAYTFGIGNPLMFARLDGAGIWQSEELLASTGPAGTPGIDAILRHTRKGYPMVVYYDEDTSTIRYMLRSPFVAP